MYCCRSMIAEGVARMCLQVGVLHTGFRQPFTQCEIHNYIHCQHRYFEVATWCSSACSSAIDQRYRQLTHSSGHWSSRYSETSIQHESQPPMSNNRDCEQAGHTVCRGMNGVHRPIAFHWFCTSRLPASIDVATKECGDLDIKS